MQETHMANCLEVAFKTNITKPRRQSLVVKTADWIIDIGPEGGDGGGQLVGVGTPETLSENEQSYTGHYLKDILTPKKVAAE
mgnify:CR=1 FL=1